MDITVLQDLLFYVGTFYPGKGPGAPTYDFEYKPNKDRTYAEYLFHILDYKPDFNGGYQIGKFYISFGSEGELWCMDTGDLI